MSVSAETINSNAKVRLEVDTRTGELVQPTLDDAIFPAVSRRDVPAVKVSFSGTVELAQSDWEAYCRQGLEPGRLVTVSLTGYLPNPHAAWVRRTESDPMTREKHVWWEREGRITIKALELGSLELGDVYDGD